MEKYFRTTDNDLAAYLITISHKPLETTIENGRYLAFQFPDSPELRKEVSNFYNNQTLVDARTICENVRKLKVLLTQYRQNQKIMGGGGQK
jgi:hypothetical protein